jgi:hypothetical protein
MGLVLFIILFFSGIENSQAQDSFFQKSDPQCFIQSFNEGKLNTVDAKTFYDHALKVKQLPRNPNMVAFKWEDVIYVTPKNCVTGNSAQVVSEKKGMTVVKARKIVTTDPLKLWLQKENFIMIDFGKPMVADNNPVASDYNEVFPEVTTNPTTWGEAENSNYSTGISFSGTFGIRQTPSRFLAFKIRSFSGKKIDTLTLTDVNSGISQEGSWIYEDSFINLYGGFHFEFLPESYWKPTLSGFIGVSRATSTLTDNDVTYKLNSFGFALLAEVGIERILSESWAIGTTLGVEYLGPRSLKFEDTDEAQGFTSKMTYNNINVAMGVKYAF